MNDQNKISCPRVVRVVSLLALGTLAGIACTRAATNSENTASTGSSGTESTADPNASDAAVAATDPTPAGQTTVDAGGTPLVAERLASPYAERPENGRPCRPQPADPSRPNLAFGGCECAPNAASPLGGTLRCPVPVSGPLSPPELA